MATSEKRHWQGLHAGEVGEGTCYTLVAVFALIPSDINIFLWTRAGVNLGLGWHASDRFPHLVWMWSFKMKKNCRGVFLGSCFTQVQSALGSFNITFWASFLPASSFAGLCLLSTNWFLWFSRVFSFYQCVSFDIASRSSKAAVYSAAAGGWLLTSNYFCNIVSFSGIRLVFDLTSPNSFQL